MLWLPILDDTRLGVKCINLMALELCVVHTERDAAGFQHTDGIGT